MSLQDLIARLRADLAAATVEIAEFQTVYPATNAAVNAAPTLLDVVDAAAKYREAMRMCNVADDVELFERAHQAYLDALTALFAALDRAEAEAAR